MYFFGSTQLYQKKIFFLIVFLEAWRGSIFQEWNRGKSEKLNTFV